MIIFTRQIINFIIPLINTFKIQSDRNQSYYTIEYKH